jgi:tRNA(His) guanylyltransferase
MNWKKIMAKTNSKQSLGDRMKLYEAITDIRMTRRMPVVVRLDGRAFHSWTKRQKLERPFDDRFRRTMAEAAWQVCQNIPTSVLAYTQSDEISILLFNYNKFESQPYCDNRVQKLVTHAASIAASVLTLEYQTLTIFDGRAFALPEAEVCNYFIERQQDCVRNSIQMVGQANFSHKQLQKKSCPEIQEMLFQEKGINWSKYPTDKKRGICVKRISPDGLLTTWRTRDLDIPEFSKNRAYIEELLVPEEK